MKLSKSKLALAKVINENGGWIGDAPKWAAQDNCIAFFSGGKPEYKSGDRCWYSNSLDGACVGAIKIDEKATNWHQTILSREEYYQAYPKADADGWIEWNQGNRPVIASTLVDVRYGNGSVECGLDAGGYSWSWSGDGLRIAAYRLHKPGVKTEPCESVTRSITDPEAKPTIEQLAQDYRNALDYASRLQKEADEAAKVAGAKLCELGRAGESIGLLIGIAKHEPELVISDWRDLRVNDVIFVGKYDDHESGEYVVIWLEDRDYGNGYAVKTSGIDGNERWIDTTMEWRFIRRP